MQRKPSRACCLGSMQLLSCLWVSSLDATRGVCAVVRQGAQFRLCSTPAVQVPHDVWHGLLQPPVALLILKSENPRESVSSSQYLAAVVSDAYDVLPSVASEARHR